MACPLRRPGSPPGIDWDKMETDMIAGGMTQDEARKTIAEMATPDAIKEGMESQRLNDVVTYGTDFNARNAAAAEIAKEPLSKTLNDPTRMNSEEVQAAWKEKGIIITALKGTFDRTKVQEKDYLAARLAAGDTTAKGYAKNVTLNGTIIDKVKLVNTLAQSTTLKYEDAIRGTIGDQILVDYKKYYSDFKNVSKNNITIDQVYGRMSWNDGMGTKYEFDVVNGSNQVFDPTTGKYINDPTKLAEQKIQQGYKTATLTFNKAKYAELLLSGKTPTRAELDTMLTNGNDPNWWSCVGTLCNAAQGQPDTGTGGGGGGGGGGSGSSRSTAPKNPSLFIESNTDADVWDAATQKKLGTTNNIISMKSGNYTIETRKLGYKRVSRAVTIGNYPINVTMNMYKVPTGPATFIATLGGLSNLKAEHVLYTYCIYKARTTGALDWRTLASELQPTFTAPEQLTISDVQYLWYLANGEPGKAAQLLADGKVSLADGEE